jgi:aspartate-semialdehyde dehydrogenase
MSLNIAIVGSTGLVGRTMLKVLEERNLPISTLTLLASAASSGKTQIFKGQSIPVQELTEHSFEHIDIALFSAGGTISKKYAKIAASNGCIVIDNSSAWRMDPDVPLIVPEVNPEQIPFHKNIIANPNCSTIQLVLALQPLHIMFGIKRVIVSTYQSVSGAGQQGIDQLTEELAGKEPSTRISEFPLAFNTVFHPKKENKIGHFTEEEDKIIYETQRIMGIKHLPIAVTCVRIPTIGGHGESVLVELEKKVALTDIFKVFSNSKGIVLQDEDNSTFAPMPIYSQGKDEVFIGRIRKDPSSDNGIMFWIVADNLRKGAATNAVQIAELLIAHTAL